MATTVPQTYVVKQGDSLSLISKKLYGDFSMVNALAEANKISNPNLILPGQQLIIPVPPKSLDTDGLVPGASSNGQASSSVTTTTTTTSSSIKTVIGKYFGWGILGIAVVLLAYEANKEHKKQKASKTATPAKKLSGPGKKRKKKAKALKGSSDVSQAVTYIQNDDELKGKEVSMTTVDKAVKKFNREFPGEKLTLSVDDKAKVIEQLKAA